MKHEHLQAIRADELLDLQFASREMLVDKLIGNGVFLLCGQPKVGKSFISMLLSVCVTTQTPFLGLKTRKTGVLYLCLEDTMPRIQERLAKISGGEVGDNLYFCTSIPDLNEGFLEEIEEFLTNHPDVGLVIIDTLQKIRPSRAETYSYAGDYSVISQLKTVADKMNISILAIHHTRKSFGPQTDVFQSVSGTSALSGAADGTILLLRETHTERQARLCVTGRDIMSMELLISFNTETTIWEFVGYAGENQVPKKDLLIDEVHNLLLETGSFHGKASDLFEILRARSDLPIKSPNALTRLLNPQKLFMQSEYHITYDCERTANARILHLTFSPKDDDTTKSVET